MTAPLVGKDALAAEVGNRQFHASWTSNEHRMRRLLAEFIGMFGLVFILSGGAAVLAKYGGGDPNTYAVALILSAFSALWLMVAIFFLGDCQQDIRWHCVFFSRCDRANDALLLMVG